MEKFDFIRLSLSNPQSGQSPFLFHDSNSSLFLSPVSSIYIQGVFESRVYSIKISHAFEDNFEKYKIFFL